tara:strand:- start:690 stop:1016 length:327 start_codon:yes stop_codon:yes gene_type:complete
MVRKKLQVPQRADGDSTGQTKMLQDQIDAVQTPQATTTPTPTVQRQAPAIDVFGQTQNPSEPVTSGLPFGPGATPVAPMQDDADMLLRAIYNVYPDPSLLRFLRGTGA